MTLSPNKELKPALDFDNQVKLLKDRGLIIQDEAWCKDVLSRVNYYKLSGYSLHLRKDDIFYPGVTFEMIYRTYIFDKRLSALLYDLFETVEVSLKTQVANYLSVIYDPLCYLNSKYFRNNVYHEQSVNEYNKEKMRSYGKILFVTHNVNEYGNLPFWVAIEILPFGWISKLFKNLKNSEQKAIIRNMTGTFINPKCFSSWIMSIVNMRNRTAHQGRLYNRNISSQVRLTHNQIKYFCDNNIHIDDSSLFALIYVTRELITNKDQWTRVFHALVELIDLNSDVIDVSKMGFPDKWKAILS